jgi:hypothetical protein
MTDPTSRIDRYELMSTLSPAEFADYLAAETELEQQLFDAATDFARQSAFDKAEDVLEHAITLNRTLRSIAERELARQDLTDARYRRWLSDTRDDSSGIIYLLQGQLYRNRADERLLAGEVSDACAVLAKASRCYQDLIAAALPQHEFATLASDLLRTKIEFLRAAVALRRGKYEVAREGFHQAKVTGTYLLEQLAGCTGARLSVSVKELQREFAGQQRHTHVMLKYADFFFRIQSGDFEYAIGCAHDTVSLYEALLQSALSDKLAKDEQDLREMELEYFRGWLAWAKAEYAVTNEDWDDCVSFVNRARQNWFRSGDLAMRHALRGVMSPQVETANTEMLLQSTLRRCRSERRLNEQLEQLRDENRKLGNIYLAGGNMSHETGNVNVPGQVTGNIIGGKKNKATTERISGKNVQMAELRDLAEQLAELRDASAAGARTDQEKAAVEEIDLAEQDARRGDEKGARRHLAAAGKWALALAEKLSLPVAEAAIKASIGA